MIVNRNEVGIFRNRLYEPDQADRLTQLGFVNHNNELYNLVHSKKLHARLTTCTTCTTACTAFTACTVCMTRAAYKV